MKEFNIYFSDLSDDAKKELMEFVGVKNPKEMNWDEDLVPLAVIVGFEEDIEEI